MADFVAAVDQGTTSTRCMIFDHGGNEIARHQLEHSQILPRSGWVEHNPVEIWERTSSVIQTALNTRNLAASDLAALGITNQRETTLVWNRRTGRPYGNAIVWQDTRTDRIATELDHSGAGDVIRQKAGLPPATYFSGGKLKWMLDHIDGLRAGAERGDAIFGTTDTWLLWNLTGGTDGGVHVTDVTNASRTMLMDLDTLDWDDELLSFFGVPPAMLPQIRPSSSPEPYGVTLRHGPLHGEIPLTGDLGDQQAATVGQVCFAVGEAKNTYGTGNFLLLNTGTELIRSKQRPADDRRLPVRRPARGLRARRVDRGHRRGRPVAARPARHHQRRCGKRGPGPAGRRLRRHLLRARVLRPVRAVLAVGRARRHRRAVPLPHQCPPGPRDAGGDLLPEPRRGRGDGAGLRRAPRRAQGRRRRHRQRPVHATAGGHPRRAGQPPGGRGDDGARRRLRGRAGHRLLGRYRGTAGQLERIQALGAHLDASNSGRMATPAGRRPSGAPWTGSTSARRRPFPEARYGRRFSADRQPCASRHGVAAGGGMLG